MTSTPESSLSPQQQNALKIVESFYEQFSDSRISVFGELGSKIVEATFPTSRRMFHAYYYWDINIQVWVLKNHYVI